jgi:hypothetical protein
MVMGVAGWGVKSHGTCMWSLGSRRGVSDRASNVDGRVSHGRGGRLSVEDEVNKSPNRLDARRREMLVRCLLNKFVVGPVGVAEEG